MKEKVFPTIIILIILFAVYFLFFKQDPKGFANNKSQIYETVCGKYQKEELKIGSKILSVDIADSVCKQTLGLSGKTSLNEDSGMIFIFEKEGNYGFWMKDMNFPLDILWINDNFEIVGMEKDIATSTYPQSYGENYFAKYVVEISAGYSDKNNIKVGEQIIFSENYL